MMGVAPQAFVLYKGAEPRKKKQRSWAFRVSGIKAEGPNIKYADVLAAFSERYTAVKRLVISPANGSGGGSINTWGAARIVADFRGPTPGAGPGKCLCRLLNGSSVYEEPVMIGFGQRNKRARSELSPSVAGDSDAENARVKKMKDALRNAHIPKQAHEDARHFPGAISTQTTSRIEIVGENSRTSNPGSLIPSTNLSPPPRVDSAPILSKPSIRAHAVSPDEKHLEWDDVLRRVEPPPRSPIRQHSLDVGDDISLSSDSDDTQDGQIVESYDFKSEAMDTPFLGSYTPFSGSRSSWVGSAARDVVEKQDRPMPSCDSNPPYLVKGLSFTSVLGIASIKTYPGEVEGTVAPSPSVAKVSSDQENTFPAAADGKSAFVFGKRADARVGCVGERKLSPDTTGMSTYLPEGTKRVRGGICVEPLQKDCDFKGVVDPVKLMASPASPCASRSGREYLLEFMGLNGIGQAFRDLAVTALFSVDSSHQAVKVASPIEVCTTGNAYAAVSYPCMSELWPELADATNVGTVKVDLSVEIRSSNGEFHFVAPKRQVTYRR